MRSPTKQAIAGELLDRYGRTYAEQAGFSVRDKPAALYKLLVLSTLLSARIGATQAMEAARGLFDAGWTTADKLADTTWAQRRDVLNRSGYARYDESTAKMLGDSMALLTDRWDGDLRKLREEADHDPERMRALLKELKGIGDVGVDIFFREVQSVWEELRPFADERALAVARDLDLADDASSLARRCDDEDLPRLVAALVRAGLDDARDEILAAAAG